MFPFSRAPRRAPILALSALLAAGVFVPALAQSAPDPNPPIANGTFDRARRNDRNGQLLRGTITRVYSVRSLDVRADDGRIYRVSLPVSIGLQVGTDVRLRGDLNGSSFNARVVSLGQFNDRNDDGYSNNGGYNNNGGYSNGGGGYQNGGGGYGDDGYGGVYNNNGGYQNGGYPDDNGGYGQQVILRGRVTRIYNRADFEVRDDDDGRVYRVTTNVPLASSVRVGDRLETRGALNGNRITATSAGAIGSSDNGNNGTRDVAVNFPGRIDSIDLYNERANVRGDNGRVYPIHLRRTRLDDFRVGQRVRVQGVTIGGVVEVSDLSRE